MAIRAQLAQTDGLIGYALNAHLTRKTYYTLSAWDSQDALDAFSRADPDRSAGADRMPDRLRCCGADGPVPKR